MRKVIPVLALLFSGPVTHAFTGEFSHKITINLPTSGCGVRLNSRTNEDGLSEMFFTVNLVIQQDKHLRQIADLETKVNCLTDDDVFLVKSDNMIKALKSDFLGDNKSHR